MGINYGDPRFDPHAAFNRWKLHPFVKGLLEGHARALRREDRPVRRILRDAENVGRRIPDHRRRRRILELGAPEGIHLAMKSGLLAADALFDAITRDRFDDATLELYHQLFKKSWARDELFALRNFHQSFDGNFWWGFLKAGFITLSNGVLFGGRATAHADHEHYRRLRAGEDSQVASNALAFDDKITFDKLKGAYFSGTIHEEDQPSHLKILDPSICVTRCAAEYGNPCQRFCPVFVY